MKTIALLTDFGLSDGFVGAMKGVINSIAPDTRVIDITHDCAPQNIRQGAFILWTVYRFFPPDAIFVVIVDPDVGTERRIILVESNDGQRFLFPENGVMDYVLPELEEIKIYHVNNKKYWLSSVSYTFHGRDIFSPVAAHLSSGVSAEEIGARIQITIPPSPFININNTIDGEVVGLILHVDKFGNLVTNFRPAEGSQGKLSMLSVDIGGFHIDSVKQTFAEGKRGELIALVGSSGLIEIAVRNGSAQQMLGLRVGDPIILVRS